MTEPRVIDKVALGFGIGGCTFEQQGIRIYDKLAAMD